LVKPANKGKVRVKQYADYIFHELTRSICPECQTAIDAQILIQDNRAGGQIWQRSCRASTLRSLWIERRGFNL